MLRIQGQMGFVLCFCRPPKNANTGNRSRKQKSWGGVYFQYNGQAIYEGEVRIRVKSNRITSLKICHRNIEIVGKY